MAKVKSIKKRPKRKYKTPVTFTKKQFIAALENTGGIAKDIAKNLGCARSTIYKWLKDADEEILEALQDEIDSVGDVAEKTILTVMRQRLDLGVAATTSKWYLERKCTNRGYKPKTELTLEGGQNPFHVKNESILPLESLNLSIETRKELLAAMEEKESEGDNDEGEK